MLKPWVAKTAGERLLFLIAGSFRRSNPLAPANFKPDVHYSRADNLAEYFSSAFLLNLFARTFNLAEHVAETHQGLDERSLTTHLAKELEEKLGLDARDFHSNALGKISAQALTAVKVSGKDVGQAQRIQLQREPDHARPTCYFCSASLSWSSASPNYVDVDHIWPSAWGGDTEVENLLPSCKPCNSNRGDLIGWAWVAAHAVVGRHQSAGYLNSLRFPIRAAVHFKAVTSFASEQRIDLRTATLMIGPRLQAIQKWQRNESLDFFNLINHDTNHYDPDWSLG